MIRGWWADVDLLAGFRGRRSGDRPAAVVGGVLGGPRRPEAAVNGAEGGRMAAVLRHYGMDVPEGYGDRWRPLRCGFHDDAHASASYNEALDAFACMACDVKGNAVTLLMRVERLSGREADARATELAGHPGVSLAAVPARMRGGARYSSPRMRRRSA